MSKKGQMRAIDTTRKDISQAFRDANPHIFGPQPVIVSPNPAEDTKPKRAGKKRKEMNKTEADFSRLLDAKVARGEIESFEYEGITLRWPDGMRYTCDFVVWKNVDAGVINDVPVVAIILIEIKGAYAWAKDVVKFRAARDKWGDRCRFEFWQKIDGRWEETR